MLVRCVFELIDQILIEFHNFQAFEFNNLT
jgi:hypothetical protein